MSDKINTNIRYLLPNDPYYSEVDNLPLKDLVGNDISLQFQLDQLKYQIGSLTGRSTFGDLKPFTDENSPGYVFVSPGSFVARVNISSDRDNGLRERRSDGVHEQGNKFTKSQPEDPAYGFNSSDNAGGIARTALVRLLSNASVPVPSFTTEDYPDADGGSNPAPSYRLDIICVEGYPAEDNDIGRSPFVSIIQGGYFMSTPSSVAIERKEGHRFENSSGELEGRTLLQKTNTINQSNVIDEKLGNLAGGTEGLRYSTVPLLEDLRNFSYKPSKNGDGNFITIPDFENKYSDFDSSKIERWMELMSINRGIFCLPICYVLTPFGFTGNSHIPEDNLIDVRPFFRTAEMTLDERQAVATSYQPSVTNRYLTRKDPDYETLRDAWVKGQSSNGPGNHEGRIDTLEAEKKQEIVLLNEESQLGGILNNGTHLLTPSLTMAPASNEIIMMLVRVHSVGGGGGVNLAEIKYENSNGKLHNIGRNGSANGGQGQYDTIVQYTKNEGDSPSPMKFIVSGTGNGNFRVWLYGYVRLVK